jgi:flagellar hook-basal body complex protein FliE
MNQSKDPKTIVEHMKAETQATRQQRQETRTAANVLLKSIHDLEAEQEAVQEAAGQIRQIEQDVKGSSDVLHRTEQDMLWRVNENCKNHKTKK